MPTLFIPSPIRSLTQGKALVVVAGSSVREALESLEAEYPGVKERLCEGEKIRPNISVMVDGQVEQRWELEKVVESMERREIKLIAALDCPRRTLRRTLHRGTLTKLPDGISSTSP
jgi:molybdopterin synthase sulfur carrier subunit